MGRTVLIDDTDDRIVYGGVGWKILGHTFSATSNEYNRTMHYGPSPGLTMSYTFNGTRITLYGTLLSPTNLPASTYSIDDQPRMPINATGDMPHISSSVKGPLSHVPFYTSPVLPHGQHTLLVNVNVESDHTFFFDYLAVETDDSIFGSIPQDGAVVVDDRDPSIVFTGAWNDTSTLLLEYNGTSTRAPWPDDRQNSTASFNFTGKAIAVYGTIQGDYGPLPIMKCILDPVRSSLQSEPSEEQGQTRTVVFSAPGLIAQRKHHRLCLFEDLQDVENKPKGEHEIVLSTLHEAIRPWRFDYFVYLPVGSSLFFNSSGTGDVGDDEGGASISTPRGTNIPAIVAGVVVGVAVLALLVGMVFWWRWKRRRAVSFDTLGLEPAGDGRRGSNSPELDSASLHKMPGIQRRERGDMSTDLGVVEWRNGVRRPDPLIALPLKARHGHETRRRTGITEETGEIETASSISILHHQSPTLPTNTSRDPDWDPNASNYTAEHGGWGQPHSNVNAHPKRESVENALCALTPPLTASTIIQRRRSFESAVSTGRRGRPDWIQEVDGGVRLDPCDEGEGPVLLPPTYSAYQ